jgi:hypothetical protein
VAELLWNKASNKWYSSNEEAAFKLATIVRATSLISLLSLFNNYNNTEQYPNKVIFISLLPDSNKRLIPCPIIPVFPGDFLGIYSRTIRFSEKVSLLYSIPGPEPIPKLWLDYLYSTGAFNQMQVSKPNNNGNIGLYWEAVNEQDKTGPCES